MRKNLLEFYLPMVSFAMAVFVSLTAVSFAQTQPQPNSKRDDTLKTFLQNYLADSRSDSREPTRYSPAFVDLRDVGTQDIIVYVTGSFWCGSGGCTMLILAPKGLSYKVVTKIFAARSPIRILKSKSNGWHDISVTERGGYGGDAPYTYEAKLSFNGKVYRISPQDPATPRLVENLPGDIVIPATEEGTLLY